MNDQLIIENTHFEVDETERLICYTNLPDGTRFAQAVSSKEAVQKNMIGWCNTVREHILVKEANEEAEKMAAKKRRVTENAPTVEDRDSTVEARLPAESKNPRVAVLAWYDDTQAEIDALSKLIVDAKHERDRLRDERDKITPVIKAWRNGEDE